MVAGADGWLTRLDGGLNQSSRVFLLAHSTEIEKATEAIAQFGDVAVYVLAKYRDNKRIHDALCRQDIGFPLIAFLAVYGDAGLDQVADSPKWIDKYFKPDGTPREENAWFKLPLVGVPANIISNWLHKYPNGWDESGGPLGMQSTTLS